MNFAIIIRPLIRCHALWWHGTGSFACREPFLSIGRYCKSRGQWFDGSLGDFFIGQIYREGSFPRAQSIPTLECEPAELVLLHMPVPAPPAFAVCVDM